MAVVGPPRGAVPLERLGPHSLVLAFIFGRGGSGRLPALGRGCGRPTPSSTLRGPCPPENPLPQHSCQRFNAKRCQLCQDICPRSCRVTMKTHLPPTRAPELPPDSAGTATSGYPCHPAETPHLLHAVSAAACEATSGATTPGQTRTLCATLRHSWFQ